MPKTSPMPYGTDEADVRSVLRDYYATALKRFAKPFVIFAPMWVSLFVWKSDYLLPVSLVGFAGLLFIFFLCYRRVSWTWKCSRIFRRYPLEFRGPVEKVHLQRPSTLFLRLGGKGGDSPTMRAGNPMGGAGWPEGVERGVWFAGDELFGGAALVPGGELLFMQPRDWKQLAEERKNAGPERMRTARRAGIKRYTVAR